MAPNFTFKDGNTTKTLADFKGHVVLVNFWATWCPPCVAEVPSLVQLHHEMPKLVIIAVSIDQNGTAFKKFVASHHMTFITTRNPSESIPTLFHTDMWPESYLIDRNGIIRYKFISNQNWTSPEMRSMIKSLM